MSCYGMLRYVMYDVMLCHVMSCHVMPCPCHDLSISSLSFLSIAVSRLPSGARPRLILADCQSDAVIYDISSIRTDVVGDIHLVHRWDPHPAGTTTDVTVVDDIQVREESSMT